MKLIIFILNIPIYWLSVLLPKKKNLWVFGAWFGKKYADNSKYLFEYINVNIKEVNAVWITDDEKVFTKLKESGYEVVYKSTIKGYWLSMRASFWFVSTGNHDINQFLKPRKLVNLWHGSPIKKIMNDDKFTIKIDSRLKKIIKKYIFPFISFDFKNSLLTVSSKDEQKNLSSAFKMDIKDVVITGLARNDAFYLKKENNFLKKYSDKNKIIYMPTHRNHGEFDIIKEMKSQLFVLDSYLSKINSVIFISIHFYHQDELKKYKSLANVIILDDSITEQDIYTILPHMDLLITDYSSVYMDFLLTEKPILFLPFDYEEYLGKDRELYYDYDDVTPGPKCKTWDEAIKLSEQLLKNPSLYSKERDNIKNRFQQYQDGNNCKRIYSFIMEQECI